MIASLAELWEPFVTTDPGPGTAIELREETEDLWQRLDRASHEIFRSAISGLQDRLDVHAGVLQHEQHVVMLPGAPGTGKTTLTLELLRRGWTYVSDDLAPLDLESGRIDAFPKPLSVKEPSRWNDYLRSWELASTLPVPHELFLIPPTLFGYCYGQTLKPTHVFFPSRTGAPRLETVAPGQAVYRLGELVSHDRVTPIGLGSLKKLCREAQLAEVTYKEAPQAADLIESVLGS